MRVESDVREAGIDGAGREANFELAACEALLIYGEANAAFLEERRALMQAWADYLQGTQAVVALSETAVFAIEWRSPRARHEAKSAASNFR